MSDFNKEKVTVTLAEDITLEGPIIPRKYTLTHSDEDGQLFLSIGKCYDFSKVSDLRDEVLGAWSCEDDDSYTLKLSVLVDGAGDEEVSEMRNKIFRRELPLAIKAIIYGDRGLFAAYKTLAEGKLFIIFKSRYAKYNVEEQWGCIKDYKVEVCDDKRMEIEESNVGYRMMVDATGKDINVEKFNPMPIDGNMQNYPIPLEPGPSYPNQQGHFAPGPIFPNQPGPKNKNKIIENALIDMLSVYIENQVYMNLGNNTPFCLRQSEVLNARVVATYGPCRQEYEITVGVKAGRVPTPYFNLIITFLINNSRVTVKYVKNPRES